MTFSNIYSGVFIHIIIQMYSKYICTRIQWFSSLFCHFLCMCGVCSFVCVQYGPFYISLTLSRSPHFRSVSVTMFFSSWKKFIGIYIIIKFELCIYERCLHRPSGMLLLLLFSFFFPCTVRFILLFDMW